MDPALMNYLLSGQKSAAPQSNEQAGEESQSMPPQVGMRGRRRPIRFMNPAGGVAPYGGGGQYGDSPGVAPFGGGNRFGDSPGVAPFGGGGHYGDMQ